MKELEEIYDEKEKKKLKMEMRMLVFDLFEAEVK